MKVTYATLEGEYGNLAALYFDGELVLDDKNGIGRDFIMDELIKRGEVVTEYDEVEAWELNSRVWPANLEHLVTVEQMNEYTEKRFAVDADLEKAFAIREAATEAELHTRGEWKTIVVFGPKWKVQKFADQMNGVAA